MICSKCNREEGIDKKIVEKYKVPYKCSCGNIKFPYKALHGVVFIWPKPVEEVTKGGLILPDIVRPSMKNYYGVILTSGRGCINKKTNKFVESELAIGDVVLFDKSIPWEMEVEAQDKKEYKVNLANLLDINALVEE